MMSWIKSQASGSAPSVPNMERKKVEPGAMYSLFENHWTQAIQVMQTCEDPEGAFTVISHLSQMIAFLVMSRGEQVTPEKSCKSFWLQHRCSDQVIRWLHNLQLQGVQMPEPDELKLIAMLHSLCEAASRDGELLGYARTPRDSDREQWDGTYALASLLLEYSLRNNVELAETARYSFIQLIQLASKFPGLERSLSQESGLGLTNVVVSGLSACFAQLPTFTTASSSQLAPFVEQLKFVNEVTQAAPEAVATTIAECFTNAFLQAVIEPALTQDEDEGSLYKPNEPDLSYVTSLNEEIGIVTSYLEVICRNVTHPALIKSLVQFVNSKLLNVLIHRLNTNESVTVTISTLSLFNALLETYCEDFWLEVILKYLTPQHHLMVSQRKQRLPSIDFYDSATRFLSILPMSICDIVGPDAIEATFLQYVNYASAQWATFDLNVRTPFSVTRRAEAEGLQLSNDSEGNQNHHAHLNPTFPLWKHKYDGGEGEKLSNGTTSNHELNSSQELYQQRPDITLTAHDMEPDSGVTEPFDSAKVPHFTTINLDLGSVEDVRRGDALQNHSKSLPKVDRASVVTNQSDGYSSMESVEPGGHDDEAGSTVASFGPFLDSLLVQLSNWPHLDLNVILVLTQIVSLLAACRIPLVNSLLLDPTLTLQPYYLTFNTLLKRIREDLEYQLKDVPIEVIRNVWDSVSRSDESRKDVYIDGGALTMSLSTSFGDQFSDTLRRTISGGGADAIANVWRRFNRMTSSSPTVKIQVHPSSGTVHRSTDGNHRIDARVDLQTELSKKMTMRLIYFYHWLLELGATGQQQCWSPAYE